MSIKVAVGILGVSIVLGAGFLLLRAERASAPTTVPATNMPIGTATSTNSAPSIAPSPSPSGQGAKASSQPNVKIGTPYTTTVHYFARFDQSLLTATSSYPVITGTANVPKVGIIIYNDTGAGIVATKDITVTNGRWAYSSSVALKPGNYALLLLGGDARMSATLTVKSP